MKKILRLVIPIIFLFSACKQVINAENKWNNFRFLEFDIQQLHQGYSSGMFTITEVVQAYLDRIELIDKNGPSLNSIIIVNPDAIKIAQKLDKDLREGKKRGPLHGVPVILKDNIDTQDKMPTTAGSRALKDSYPLKDSYVVQKLRKTGAVIIGKANLSEWANFRGQLSSSGWSGVGGQTRNPYILERNPCGSSSGSGVAVSANLCVLAIGTETNGSIVCPSHANGIVGIKPTVGLLSRSGIIPISFTQDTPGPMARTVKDAAICLGVLTGVDSSDSKTLISTGNSYGDYTQFLKNTDLKGKRLGLFIGNHGTHFKVDALMARAVDFLKSKGAEIIAVDNILGNGAFKSSIEVLLYEYKDGLNKYFKFLGPDAPIKSVEDLIAFNKQDSIELDFYDQHYLLLANEKEDLNSQEYFEALEKARSGSQENGIDKLMNELNLDAIIAPTGSPAWKTDHINGDSFMLSSSTPAAIAGYPNITVPMGFIDNLPVGISFFGRAWSEPLLLQIAYIYEQGTMFRKAPEFISE